MIFVCETEERILLKKFCEMDDRDLTEKGVAPWQCLAAVELAGYFPRRILDSRGRRARAESGRRQTVCGAHGRGRKGNFS